MISPTVTYRKIYRCTWYPCSNNSWHATTFPFTSNCHAVIATSCNWWVRSLAHGVSYRLNLAAKSCFRRSHYKPRLKKTTPGLRRGTRRTARHWQIGVKNQFVLYVRIGIVQTSKTWIYLNLKVIMSKFCCRINFDMIIYFYEIFWSRILLPGLFGNGHHAGK